MPALPNRDMFSLLPPPKSRWKEFVLGFGVSGWILAAVILMALLHPQLVEKVNQSRDAIVLVATPPVADHQPAPIRVLPVPQPVVALQKEIRDNLRLPAPKKRPLVENVVAPKIQIATEKAPIVNEHPAAIPRRPVRTNVFSTGSSAIPTLSANPKNVQTGGFGDPQGAPAADNHGRPVTIAQLGSFDLPAGAGQGNGTGGASGRPGVVASAGFGNQVATADAGERLSSSTAVVRQSGFADAHQAIAPKVSRPNPQAANTTPAEIIAKPRPIYTEEARKLRIEGEVWLEVVFEASGKLRVLRVVHSLGHGLDENAARAAEQIRFKPALKEGQPTDSTATLHIVFQLT